jgi:anti-sigma28 factor (negative regulator of flagellin synthesis)
MALPDVRKQKVEALRQFGKSGKYHVTDLEIAGVLQNDERIGSHEYSKIP